MFEALSTTRYCQHGTFHLEIPGGRWKRITYSGFGSQRTRAGMDVLSNPVRPLPHGQGYYTSLCPLNHYCSSTLYLQA